MAVYALNHVQVLLLVLLRVMMFIITSPLFSMRLYPNWTKVGFAGVVALLVIPSMSVTTVPSALLDTGEYILVAVREMATGLLLGWVASVIYATVNVAGRILDLEIGYSAVSLLAPGTNDQESVMGSFQGALFALYFIGMNGLDGLVLAVLNSYKLIPLGYFHMPGTTIQFLMYMFNVLFTMAVEVVIPFLCVLLFTDVTLAVISRSMPQLNVFIVWLPAKLFFGLSLFSIGMVGTTYLFGQIFQTLFSDTTMFLKWFGG